MNKSSNSNLLVDNSPTTLLRDKQSREKSFRDLSIGTPISRREALKICREIFETAERERLEIAKAEARRGIQYLDED